MFTKEKITFFVALAIAILAMVMSVSGFNLPAPVPEPAEAERAKPIDLGDELIPVLAPKRMLKPDEGRNPFLRAESYAEQAPVPLSLPPELPVPDTIPTAQVRSGLVYKEVRVYTPGSLDDEASVTEVSDKLPDPNSGSGDATDKDSGDKDSDEKKSGGEDTENEDSSAEKEN